MRENKRTSELAQSHILCIYLYIYNIYISPSKFTPITQKSTTTWPSPGVDASMVRVRSTYISITGINTSLSNWHHRASIDPVCT